MIVVRSHARLACVWLWAAAGCGDRSPPALWPDPPPPTLAAPIGVDEEPSETAVDVPRSPEATPSPVVTTTPDAKTPAAASDAKGARTDAGAEASDAKGDPTRRSKAPSEAP